MYYASSFPVVTSTGGSRKLAFRPTPTPLEVLCLSGCYLALGDTQVDDATTVHAIHVR